MEEYMLTTCLEFADRYEGQIFHIGDKESCENVAKYIPAISYSGDEKVLGSRLLIIPNENDMVAGELWRHSKKGVANE